MSAADFDEAISAGLEAAGKRVQADVDVSALVREIDGSLRRMTMDRVRAGLFSGERLLASIQRSLIATFGGVDDEDLPPKKLAIVAYVSKDRDCHKELCSLRTSMDGYPIRVFRYPDQQTSCSDLESLRCEILDALKDSSFGLKLKSLLKHAETVDAQVPLPLPLQAALNTPIVEAAFEEQKKGEIAPKGESEQD